MIMIDDNGEWHNNTEYWTGRHMDMDNRGGLRFKSRGHLTGSV